MVRMKLEFIFYLLFVLESNGRISYDNQQKKKETQNLQI